MVYDCSDFRYLALRKGSPGSTQCHDSCFVLNFILNQMTTGHKPEIQQTNNYNILYYSSNNNNNNVNNENQISLQHHQRCGESGLKQHRLHHPECPAPEEHAHSDSAVTGCYGRCHRTQNPCHHMPRPKDLHTNAT